MRTIRAGDYVFTVKAVMLFGGGYAAKVTATDLCDPNGGAETDQQHTELRHASAEDALRHGVLQVKEMIKQLAG
jgi:hypothetical protein